MESLNINLFHNCNILTVDKKNSKAEAMAIFHDKILAIGNESDVRKKIKEYKENYKLEHNEKIILKEHDLEGKCVVPGFIDAHMHPGYYIYYKTQLILFGIKSFSELEEKIKKEDKVREPEDWILGLDLMENNFENPDERHFPDRNDLDKIGIDRPIVIMRHDGHMCSANSKALEMLGLNASKIRGMTPESGEIKLDKDGNPTGIFTEGAISFVMDSISINMERLRNASKVFSEELASFGITTCGGILQSSGEGPAGKAGAMELPFIESIIKDGMIEQDFVFYIITDKPKKLKRINKSFQKLNKEENRFVVGGIKLFADGTFGSHTAYLFEPFNNSSDGNIGFMVNNREKLYNLSKETYELGFQTTCHAIGDRANREIVDIYRDVLLGDENIEIKELTKQKSCKFRIEHASMLKEDVIRDAAEFGLVLVCQPNFINSEYTWLENRLGANRIKYTYPFRSIIDAGIMLAGASDAPVESASVIDAFYACVTRNGLVPEQVITIEEALRIFTYNAAYALGQQDIKGSLEKGKLADFVILDHDLISISPDKLRDIKILATYHRGKLIYQA